MEAALLRGFEYYKPVIAAINVFCIADGMELIQATDLRIAVDTASSGLSSGARAAGRDTSGKKRGWSILAWAAGFGA
jgi:hypothetical protein